MAGLQIIVTATDPEGNIDVEDFRAKAEANKDNLFGAMITYPSTHGIFEESIRELVKIIHDNGGQVFMDGANMNAQVGLTNPGYIGADVCHLNLHKTFSTPHGGGGPGAGPVGVAKALVDYLPSPRVCKADDGTFYLSHPADSLGRVSGFIGNFGVMMRAYTYILSLGKEYIKYVGPLATLNANYIKESLKDCYYLPIEGICKHEFVFDGLLDKSTGVTTLDVAKRLLDYGYHAPTIYFPLLFHQSIMIEPTETESLETLDEFIDVMRKVAREAIECPEEVKTAPHHTPVRRLDETNAAKHPILRYRDLAQ